MDATQYQSCRKIVLKYAHAVQRKHGGKLCFEDLEQAGVLGIARAAQTFNPDAGAKFSTWAFLCIRQAIQDEVRQQRKAMSQNISVSSGDDQACNIVDTLGADPQTEDDVCREQVHNLLLEQIRQLPPGQQTVMLRVLQGIGLPEICRRDMRSKQATYDLYYHALTTLKKKLAHLREVPLFT